MVRDTENSKTEKLATTGTARRKIHFVLHHFIRRGSGFDNQFQDFFQVGRVYRIPGFLATSFNKEKCLEFATRGAGQSVVWRIQVRASIFIPFSGREGEQNAWRYSVLCTYSYWIRHYLNILENTCSLPHVSIEQRSLPSVLSVCIYFHTTFIYFGDY